MSVIEMENWGKQEVAERLSAVSTSPTMSRWSEHLDNLEETYHVMQDKCVAIMDRVLDFDHAIGSEEEMWKK
ncbi:unnamed protein product [Orchesella dallaii]|uniref:Uncharacterized protein n=1 Tax=Orchesella dallaii TaxID=48710 RepID=A0ABP1RKF3_9HEXA